mmetsp:Transcript_22144/g.10530  ORF Transcript_22144/g.10530 Transcript_22144/m.10530 type:complete len:227 (-) Transcript_22144:2315-2995(-)
MFTGIIEGQGKITNIQITSGQGGRFHIEASFSIDGTKIGESIAVNGVCLTAVAIKGKIFEVDISPETFEITTLKYRQTGDIVNIERALKISDRIDGHLVSGHIDGIGSLKSKKTESNSIILTFAVPEHLAQYMIKKGSVAVDGISLTINNCGKDFFEVSIIPHTAELTTIGYKKPSDKVNIETDIIGKYVEKFVAKHNNKYNDKLKKESVIDMKFLAKTGFLNKRL